jgi:hypothetical protein
LSRRLSIEDEFSFISSHFPDFPVDSLRHLDVEILGVLQRRKDFRLKDSDSLFAVINELGSQYFGLLRFVDCRNLSFTNFEVFLSCAALYASHESVWPSLCSRLHEECANQSQNSTFCERYCHGNLSYGNHGHPADALSSFRDRFSNYQVILSESSEDLLSVIEEDELQKKIDAIAQETAELSEAFKAQSRLLHDFNEIHSDVNMEIEQIHAFALQNEGPTAERMGVKNELMAYVDNLEQCNAPLRDMKVQHERFTRTSGDLQVEMTDSLCDIDALIEKVRERIPFLADSD